MAAVIKTIPRVAGGTLFILYTSAPPTIPLQVVALARDGKVTALARDGEVIVVSRSNTATVRSR